MAGVSAGLKKEGKLDLGLLVADKPASVAGVFTTNRVQAAPVRLTRERIRNGRCQAVIVNSKNANCCTGSQGEADAAAMTEFASKVLGIPEALVTVASTGVIGEPLPVAKIAAAVPKLAAALSEDGMAALAGAIMTTDTVPKSAHTVVSLPEGSFAVAGVAKGAGMIRPDMATMLAFIGTDARIDKRLLDRLLAGAVESSFNRICVDGDTSTNDACVLLASGGAPMQQITDVNSDGYEILSRAVQGLCRELAQAIVRDGEGATKFISIIVEQGRDTAECLQVAYALATSPLVKTAFFASDPNWGRILAAAGRAGLVDLDINSVKLYLNEVLVAENGGRSDSYTEEAGLRVMAQEEIDIRIVLNRGTASDRVWTCDLSHDYVRINAEYRT
jgi:glutamate N-acetyltransferase/amino-acid N-acetyltransferase